MNNAYPILQKMIPRCKWTSIKFEDLTPTELLNAFHEDGRYETRTQYIDAIDILLSHTLDAAPELDGKLFPTCDEARVTFHYLVTGALEKKGTITGQSLTEAMNKMKKYFIDRNITPHDPVNEETTEVETTRARGSKRLVAKEIYNANKDTLSSEEMITKFVEEAGLALLGARSYYHELKKEIGGKGQFIAKKPNKITKCREIYAKNKEKSREELVELFVSEGDCTPTGALTYYHKITAEHNK